MYLLWCGVQGIKKAIPLGRLGRADEVSTRLNYSHFRRSLDPVRETAPACYACTPFPKHDREGREVTPR
jgi:hypothetical protein